VSDGYEDIKNVKPRNICLVLGTKTVPSLACRDGDAGSGQSTKEILKFMNMHRGHLRLSHRADVGIREKRLWEVTWSTVRSCHCFTTWWHDEACELAQACWDVIWDVMVMKY